MRYEQSCRIQVFVGMLLYIPIHIYNDIVQDLCSDLDYKLLPTNLSLPQEPKSFLHSSDWVWVVDNADAVGLDTDLDQLGKSAKHEGLRKMYVLKIRFSLLFPSSQVARENSPVGRRTS